MSVAELVANVESIDKVANPVADAITKALPAGPVKDALSGTWLGHPLHPLLTDVVIGSWTSALVLDLIGGESAEKAADTLVAVGLAAAPPTAISGLSDWADSWGKARRVGLIHAGSQVVTTLFFAASLTARRKGSRKAGVGLSLVGAGVMTLAAYLGGHLTFRRGVGVDETTFEEGPTEWTQLMEESELPHKTATPAMVDGVTVLLYRSGDDIRAIHNRCSHRGGPLHEGECDGETVTCPWHGSMFNLKDGMIVRGPATAPQPRFDARITGGKVEIRRDPVQLHA